MFFAVPRTRQTRVVHAPHDKHVGLGEEKWEMKARQKNVVTLCVCLWVCVCRCSRTSAGESLRRSRCCVTVAFYRKSRSRKEMEDVEVVSRCSDVHSIGV